MCKIMAFTAVILGLGPLFYILLGFRSSLLSMIPTMTGWGVHLGAQAPSLGCRVPRPRSETENQGSGLAIRMPFVLENFQYHHLKALGRGLWGFEARDDP